MLYTKCPTCKQLLSDRQMIHEAILEKICIDEDMEKISEEEANNLKKELVRALNLERYCCTQRIMTYTKLIDIIK